jgi:predicted N-acetyltransferase YhbS
MTLRIRPEAAADREASVEVERAAFGSDEEPRIVETVRDLDGSFALVADEDDRVVGHIQFSRVGSARRGFSHSDRSASFRASRGMASARLSSAQGWRRRGRGAR